jgi:hypothetical protein
VADVCDPVGGGDDVCLANTHVPQITIRPHPSTSGKCLGAKTAQSKIADPQRYVLRARNIILLFGAAALDLICSGLRARAYVCVCGAGDEYSRVGRRTQIGWKKTATSGQHHLN